MDHTIEITQPDRIITQDELEQIVLSARRSISSSDHPDDRDAVRDVLCTATGAAHLLEICGGDPAEFYDIVLSLPVREFFTHGCEEDLLYAHALLRRKILNIRQGQYPAGELPAYDFPGTDGISALQALVIADMGTLVMTQKTDELRKLHDNMTRTGGRKRIREQLRRIQDDIFEDNMRIRGILTKISAEEDCPSFIDSYLARLIDRSCATEAALLQDSEECLDLYENSLDRLLSIYAHRRNGDVLRQYIKLALRSISFDSAVKMTHRAEEKFRMVCDLVRQSGLIGTDARRCCAADADVLQKVYRTYRDRYKYGWTKGSQLQMIMKEISYAEQVMRLTGRRSVYTALKSDEYRLRTEPYFTKTKEEMTEQLIYFETELADQLASAPDKGPNKLIRQLTIYIGKMLKRIRQEDNGNE